MILLFIVWAFFVCPERLAILVRIPATFDFILQQLVLLIFYRSLHLNQLKPLMIQFQVFRVQKLFWLSQDCFNSFDFGVGSSL